MSANDQPTPAAPAARRLGVWQFLALVIVYLAIIKVAGMLIGGSVDSGDEFKTASNLLRTTVIPVALSALFAIVVATWLGWWREILHEPLRVQRWVWVVPIGLLVVAAVGSSWANLADQKAQLVLLLVVLVSLVGFTEELLFRGIGLLTFRRGRFSEGQVALYSSIVFGAAHLSNALTTGSSAIFQAMAVAVSGYFFYLSRRVGGTILLAMAVHGSQDFVMLSGQVGVDPSVSPLAMAVIAVMLGLAATLWFRRRRIELPATDWAGSVAEGP